MMTKKGAYTINDKYYDLVIYYKYSYDPGDWMQPPSTDVDVYKVELNDEDITEFYFDHLSALFDDQVYQFAIQDH